MEKTPAMRHFVVPAPVAARPNKRPPGGASPLKLLIMFLTRVIRLLLGTGTWLPTGYLSTARAAHTATLLNDGTVLVTGGYNSVSKALASAEIYQPGPARWRDTSALNDARFRHTATQLSDGRVLVAGGLNASHQTLHSAEIYDPSTGVWTRTDGLAVARAAHTATLLANGTVLVAGGFNSDDGALASAEIYDPGTGKWHPAADMGRSHVYHSATRLLNGDVLIVNGFDDLSSVVPTAYVELYNHATSQWQFASRPARYSALHTTTVLADGTVLQTGGANSGTSGLQDANRLNSETVADGELSQSWAPTSPLVFGRLLHTATRLSDGTVLVAGGFSDRTLPQGSSLSSSERYYPQLSTPGNFNPNGDWLGPPDLFDARGDHTATLLPDGTVLVAGGADANVPVILDSAERFYLHL